MNNYSKNKRDTKEDESMKNTKRKSNKYNKSSKRRTSNNKCSSKYATDTHGVYSGTVDSTQAQSTDNDISWYSKNPVLLQNSANLPFGTPVGGKFTLTHHILTDEKKIDTQDIAYYLPGVTRISWAPTPGISRDASSPLNVAAANLYSWIRQANSGARNYDPNDLMIYIMCMDSLYMYHAWMMRLYGVLLNTATTVRYMPKVLCKACGGNYDDLIRNMAQLKFYINSFGARIGAMAVPNDMAFFTRHRWMCSNVYSDEISLKPQIYVFNPIGVFKFTRDAEQAGSATLKRFPWDVAVNGATFAQITAYGEELLAPIIADEDFNIMSGDILKAYQGNIVSIPAIEDNFITQISYSSEVLEQIHNLTCYRTSVLNHLQNWVISQNATKDALIFDPDIGVDNSATKPVIATTFPATVPLDLKSDVPTPGEVMIATRLASVVDLVVPDSGPVSVKITTCGSEFVTGINVFQFSDGVYSPEGDVYVDSKYTYTALEFLKVTGTSPNYSVASWDGPISWSTAYYLLNAFGNGATDRFPLQVFDIAAINGEDSWLNVKSAWKIIGQKNNLTTYDAEVLEKIHHTALLSMYNVPAMGLRK